MDRAGSSPAESFVTSQAKTHPYGRVDPSSVKRRVVKRGGAALFYDRTPCADTRRMGKGVAACRKQEIGAHTPASGTGVPIRATARVVNVRWSERGGCSTRERREFREPATTASDTELGWLARLRFIRDGVTPRMVSAPAGPRRLPERPSSTLGGQSRSL